MREELRHKGDVDLYIMHGRASACNLSTNSPSPSVNCAHTHTHAHLPIFAIMHAYNDNMLRFIVTSHECICSEVSVHEAAKQVVGPRMPGSEADSGAGTSSTPRPRNFKALVQIIVKPSSFSSVFQMCFHPCNSRHPDQPSLSPTLKALWRLNR